MEESSKPYDGVHQAIEPFIDFANSRFGLIGLLYDIDLLPEQINTMRDAAHFCAICAVWKAGEEGTLPLLPTPPKKD